MQPPPPPIGNSAMAPAPILPAAAAPTRPVAQAPGEGSNALASFGAEGGASEGKGTGIGAGTGSGGEGGGTGGGSGAGSLPYTTVAHPPVPLTRVLPEYPRLARARGLEGEVVLRAIVDSDGTVERDIEVLQSVPLLNEAAIAALRHWRFEPGRDAGNRPVRVVIQVPLRFRLR
jgi:periplasmic protein TonB